MICFRDILPLFWPENTEFGFFFSFVVVVRVWQKRLAVVLCSLILTPPPIPSFLPSFLSSFCLHSSLHRSLPVPWHCLDNSCGWIRGPLSTTSPWLLRPAPQYQSLPASSCWNPPSSCPLSVVHLGLLHGASAKLLLLTDMKSRRVAACFCVSGPESWVVTGCPSFSLSTKLWSGSWRTKNKTKQKTPH